MVEFHPLAFMLDDNLKAVRILFPGKDPELRSSIGELHFLGRINGIVGRNDTTEMQILFTHELPYSNDWNRNFHYVFGEGSKAYLGHVLSCFFPFSNRLDRGSNRRNVIFLHVS